MKYDGAGEHRELGFKPSLSTITKDEYDDFESMYGEGTLESLDQEHMMEERLESLRLDYERRNEIVKNSEETTEQRLLKNEYFGENKEVLIHKLRLRIEKIKGTVHRVSTRTAYYVRRALGRDLDSDYAESKKLLIRSITPGGDPQEEEEEEEQREESWRPSDDMTVIRNVVFCGATVKDGRLVQMPFFLRTGDRKEKREVEEVEVSRSGLGFAQ